MIDLPDNEPAFPVQDCAAFQCHGMTLRDWFAGHCAHAEIITASSSEDNAYALGCAAERAGISIPQRIAFNAYEMADAMLAARTTPTPTQGSE